MTFTRITRVELPEHAVTGSGFDILMETDGGVPFCQCIVRHDDGWESIVKEQSVRAEGSHRYVFQVPPEAYHAGRLYLQVEGCRTGTIGEASAEDWVTIYCELEAIDDPEDALSGLIGGPAPEAPSPPADTPPPAPVQSEAPTPAATPAADTGQPVLYFAIHKHMHQPYYRAADPSHWDGEKEEIFGSRGGPYTRFLPAAVRQYIEGNLPHAGLSTSWSGSLIEQLDRCAAEGLCGGQFANWSDDLRSVAGEQTARGHARLAFTAFGHFHPLMPLVPHRDVVGQIAWHRACIRETFGAEPAPVLFPPETAFHPHLIPALKEAGLRAVIFDSIHHFRACKDYPYAGREEGMLPPNPSEQENFAVDDWLQLDCIWAPSKISPQLLKPCMLCYTDPDGVRHEIVGVPAERYLGNEDARGGYGALQYEMVMGQIYDHILASGTYDPEHPPFFVLHSDGDNHGGGAESYYTCNTAGLVRMCQSDPRFQLTSIEDYLDRFPVDPANIVHIEPGAWAGADNGDPQFTKWFSWVERDYSPDLNSWAVLTAFQNVVHSLEDSGDLEGDELAAVQRLLYAAETSCYWYWTGQEIWDGQVTAAVNRGMAIADAARGGLVDSGQDRTPPTIFLPWVRPANPGGEDWGEGDLQPAAAEGTVRTFVHDISGVAEVTLHAVEVGGFSKAFPMEALGPYPSQTDPAVVAEQYRAILPAGSGDLRYFVEATDTKGNTARSPLQRIYIA